MPPIDRNELRRLALLLSLGASLPACGGASADTRHGDPTVGGNGNSGPTSEAYADPADEAYYGPTGEAYYGPTGEVGPTGEAYYGPTGEGYYPPTGES